MDFSWLSEYGPLLISGAKMTIYLSICTVFFGVILGVLLSLLRQSSFKPISIIAVAWIEFIRGTPLLVQIFLIHFAILPAIFGSGFPDFLSGIIALSLNSSAYIAEIFRAGIQSIDKGQTEAARSLGMSGSMSMRYIILPQAFRNILPALGNEFIVIIKESSIVSVIGLHELMFNADTIRGSLYLAFEPLMAAALIYFVMTFTLSRLLGVAERRMSN